MALAPGGRCLDCFAVVDSLAGPIDPLAQLLVQCKHGFIRIVRRLGVVLVSSKKDRCLHTKQRSIPRQEHFRPACVCHLESRAVSEFVYFLDARLAWLEYAFWSILASL